MPTDVRRCLALALATALLAGACGKRGAPLAPIVRIPAAITSIAATRIGNDAYVTVTVPNANLDASMPADIARVEIYGYTARVAPPPMRFTEVGAVVASFPVAPPPDPLAPVPTPAPGFIDPQGAWQGTPIVVRDELTADELVHGPELPLDPRIQRQLKAGVVLAPPPTGALKRFYVAIPFSSRGRPGPPGTPAEIVLTALPDPPGEPRAAYGPASVSLSWGPSGGLLGFLLDRGLLAEPVPFDPPPMAVTPASQPADAAVPPGPTGYNVYRAVSPDPFAFPAPSLPSWTLTAPLPINPVPLPALAVEDAVEFGRVRCYTVRAARGAIVSEASPPYCFMPVDVFPPAPPTGLAAVPSEGGISLIWEPSLELDFGGYLVLRRDGTDATLRQLTDTPIVDARFRDTTVTPGVRYTYSVVTVDAQLPLPNMSAESEPVEEIAR